MIQYQDVQNCMICDKGIKEKQFKNIILKALTRKHNASVKLFYLQMLNQIISKGKSELFINFLEVAVYNKPKECLKKYYKRDTYLPKVIQNSLSSLDEILHPKIYSDKNYEIMNRYNRKRVQYAKWKIEMKKYSQ